MSNNLAYFLFRCLAVRRSHSAWLSSENDNYVHDLGHCPYSVRFAIYPGGVWREFLSEIPQWAGVVMKI